MKYLVFAVVAMGVALCSCEGRTSKNMVPANDTVEVVINQQEETADSMATLATDSMATAAQEL